MPESVTVVTLAAELKAMGNRLDAFGRELKTHVTDCAADNAAAKAAARAAEKKRADDAKKLGARIWQVCLIIISVLGSLIVADITQRKDSSAAVATVAASTAGSAATADKLDNQKLDILIREIEAQRHDR